MPAVCFSAHLYCPSSLIAYVDAGNSEVAQLLLEKYKVEVNIVDKNGWTPLHSACNAGKLPVVDLLITKGAFCRYLIF